MTRKKKVMIIVFSILGAVIIALSAVLTAAAIMGRPLKVNPSRKLDGVEGDIQNALWYSSIAANSHNTQMWSVKLYFNENRLQISIDESRVLNVVDSEKREAYISLGCYIETMSVALKAYGYDTQVNCHDMTVNVTYQKRNNATVDTDKLSLIDKRHTDKSAFSNSKIKQETASDYSISIPIYRCTKTATKTLLMLNAFQWTRLRCNRQIKHTATN